ncbi:MAG: thiamine-phosphate kinase [Gammaproteobacteria bacterium]|nr:thiamine-phosphate kinase [Gammaproteobacteria bacterium]
MSEFDLIDALLADEPPLPSWVSMGPGDDAAVLAPPPDSEWVLSTDTLVEGRHFFAGTPPDLLAYRALAVNLSDLAAMGAAPSGFLVALVAPELDGAWCRRFSAGLRAASADSGARLVGGNLARGPLAVTVTVTGTLPRGSALLRSGAAVGDVIYVSGPIGAALAARRVLEGDAAVRAALPGMSVNEVPDALRAYLLPTARVALGAQLRGIASACIDVSDGLLADLAHICDRSSVAAQIDLESLPVKGVNPLEAVVAGDDYELLFTVPEERAMHLPDNGLALTAIGRIEHGAGVRLMAADGREVAPAERGWSHF